MKSWRQAFLAVVALFVAKLALASEGISTPTGVCQLGYWSSNRNLDDSANLGLLNCSLAWRQSLGESARAVVAGRGGYRASGAADDWDDRIREAYLDLQNGPWSLRLGRQVFAWGRADRINPTDNLSPRDFTLLAAEDEDQKLGIDAARVRYELSSSLSASALVATFGAHKTPTGSLPTNTIQATAPDRAEWAIKIDHTGGLDWSMSYFDGYERFARYTTLFRSPAVFVFQGAFERSQVLGVDAATGLGAWTARAELAYSELRPDCTACAQYKRKLARAVVGVDRDIMESSNVNFQVFALRRSSYDDPAGLSGARQAIAMGLDRLNSEFGRDEWGATFRLVHRAINERLKLEVSGIADVTNRSGVIRPRVTFASSDRVKYGAGLDYFRGKAQSFFGSRISNKAAFADVSVVF